MKQILSQHEDQSNLFVIDIPGQIEVFTWSSSSLILTETIATLMPVKIVYIVDSVRCNNPNVFLSNILFARNNSTMQSLYSSASINFPLLCCSTRLTAVTLKNLRSG